MKWGDHVAGLLFGAEVEGDALLGNLEGTSTELHGVTNPENRTLLGEEWLAAPPTERRIKSFGSGEV
jgi:hypothetical protein